MHTDLLMVGGVLNVSFPNGNGKNLNNVKESSVFSETSPLNLPASCCKRLKVDEVMNSISFQNF